MENFGLRLKHLRESRGLTIKDLANAVEINSLMLKEWEEGKRYLTIGRLIRLAQYFRVSMDYLVGF